MEKLISKIKRIKCRIFQRKSKKEIFCYGDTKCDGCCGVDVCECGNKLLYEKSSWKKSF